MPKEVEKLFEETASVDVMNSPLEVPETKEPEVEEKTEPEEDLGEAKRRREKRLMDKLQAERESNIAMAARLEALSEASKLREDTGSDYLKKIERIYGTDSPESQAATALLTEALKGVEESAFKRAVDTMEQKQRDREEAVRKEEQRLSGYIEELEDTYEVSFTPDMEKAYFKMLEKLSPKDSDGKIIEYADPHSVWDLFKEKLAARQTDTRQKDIASRSIENGTAQTDSKVQDDAMRRLMRDAGII